MCRSLTHNIHNNMNYLNEIKNPAFNALPREIRDDIIDSMFDEIRDMPHELVIALCLTAMSPDEIAERASAARESLDDLA